MSTSTENIRLQVIHIFFSIIFPIEWVVTHTTSSTTGTKDGAWQLTAHTTTSTSSTGLFRITATAHKLQDVFRCISCSLAHVVWNEALVNMISFPAKLYWIQCWGYSAYSCSPICHLEVSS